MLFYEKLKELRIKSGLTQHAMAQKLQINDRSYQNYEYGKREPNIEALIRISAILHVSLDELVCRSDYLSAHEVFFDECQTNPPTYPTK